MLKDRRDEIDWMRSVRVSMTPKQKIQQGSNEAVTPLVLFRARMAWLPLWKPGFLYRGTRKYICVRTDTVLAAIVMCLLLVGFSACGQKAENPTSNKHM